MREFKEKQTNVALRQFFIVMQNVSDRLPAINKTLTINIVKRGTVVYGAAEATSSQCTLSGVGTGSYQITLGINDLDLVGEAMLMITADGCITQFIPIKTKEYDPDYIGSELDWCNNYIGKYIPEVTPGQAGGLPTVDANNLIAGIQGTKNTLDNLNDVSSSAIGTIVSNAQTAIVAEVDANEAKIDTAISNIAAHDSKLDGAITTINSINGKTTNLPSVPASAGNVSDAQTAIVAEINGNETKIDSVITDIAALNNLSAAEVQAELESYDALKRDEATADKNEIIAEIDINEAKIDAIELAVPDNVATQEDVLAIKVKTDNLPDDPASESGINTNKALIEDIIEFLQGVGAPIIPVPGGPAMPYCIKSSLVDIFGETNIYKWADLDNDGNNEKINNRIARAIGWASNEIDSWMRKGIYASPIVNTDGAVPLDIVDISATLAGVWLYENRGVQDFDPETGKPFHKLQWQRERSMKILKELCAGQRTLNAMRTSSSDSVPKAL